MRGKQNDLLPEKVQQTIAQAAENIIHSMEAEGIEVADSLGSATDSLWVALNVIEAHFHSLAMKRGVANFDARIEKMERYLSDHNLVAGAELSKRLGLSKKEFLAAYDEKIIQPTQTPYDFAIFYQKGPLALYYSADISISPEDQRYVKRLAQFIETQRD